MTVTLWSNGKPEQDFERMKNTIKQSTVRAGFLVSALASACLFASPVSAQNNQGNDNNQGNNSGPLPAPPASAAPAVAAPPTAQVQGVQITVIQAAPKTVAQAPASVLGTQITEEADNLSVTGANSGSYTAAGMGLTAAGALMIGLSRRRRSARN